MDSIHTLDLPKKNQTSDLDLIKLADSQNRIIITKDSDFLDNFILNNSPRKLLIVTTGNTSNNSLIDLFSNQLNTLIKIFADASVVELSIDRITIHV